ncbi:non-homologous end-joining DNA ligase [Streptantibioticus silvisoli]
MTAGRGPLDALPAEQRSRLSPGRPLRLTRPMLAVRSDRSDFDDRWLFERKLDGVRVLAARSGTGAELVSRTGQPLSATYPEIAAALAPQRHDDLVLDGEVVALDRGRTSFSLLQRRMGLTDARAAAASGVTVTYYVFDLLRLDGHDLTRLPLRTRKALLRRELVLAAPLRLTPHRNAWDPAMLQDACRRGWEGLIAKRADGRYAEGRSADWLKLKCSAGQELVIGGWTAPSGARTGFGALLLGHHDEPGGALRYAGKVGTGFDQAALRRIAALLSGLARPASPFADPVRESAAHWVEPRLVAQIAFTEWTRDGKLRHPRFLGLRDDKPAGQVVRERPQG